MNELYGIFKKMAYDNHFESFTKELNSAYLTGETRKTLTPITKRGENDTSHGSFMLISNGICYTTFIHNYGGHDDDPFSKTLVLELAEFALDRVLSDDFDIDKDVKVICFDKEKSITGHINATSAFKCNSMCLIGDEIHITLGVHVDNKLHTLFTARYNTVTKVMSPAVPAMLRYKGEVFPMDEAGFRRIYVSEGICSNASGSVEATAAWSEYKGEYYSTVALSASNENPGLVLKTKDFVTFDCVSAVKSGTSSCEIASCIHTDQLYVLCRQKWGEATAIVTRYDLEKGEWLEPYPIEDGISRPWFFILNDEVYLYNTIEEASRRYVNISRIRTDRKAHNHKNAPMDTVATLYDCGSYHSFCVYEGRIFFLGTYRGSVHFGELKLKLHDTEKVNDRLLELFGDV